MNAARPQWLTTSSGGSRAESITMYTHTQWYLLSTVRLGGLLVLVLSIGGKIERMALPSWMVMSIGAIVVVIGAALVNTWAISYDTYVEERQREKSG